MDTRDRLMRLISDGIDVMQISDNSNKSILIRGCDPEMGRRAIELLTPVLGNPEMVSVTNDDDFIKELQKKSGQLFILHQEHVDMIQQNHPFQVVGHKRKVGDLQSIEP
ncbi:MAG: hypothetical protein NZ604_07750 [Flavobacteriales bacterium]|nr:hypothetical protein [Flavobacteriales bacterium]